MDEGVLLHRRDDVVQQVKLLQRVETDEGLVTHGLDLVAAQGQDLKVGQVAEGGGHVLDRVTEN